MSWLDKLEKRFGFIAIPGLIRAVVLFNVLVLGLVWLNPDFRFFIDLDPSRILHGQIWRLVTYIFIPQTFSWWVVLFLWFLWFIGDGLERAWGAFKLTLYFLVGMIGTTIAAFFFGSNFSNSMLISSLFFAFARFYPDVVIYVFFILPVKIKWLAWFSAGVLLVGFILNPNASYRVSLIAAFSNYFIFFGPQIIHDIRNRREIATRRQRFEVESRSEAESLHKCAVCGATELTDPNLDFRVARDGEEYCVPHLPGAQTAAIPTQDRHPPSAV